jgi:hypothetical protein
MIVQKRPFERLVRFFLLCGGVLLLATLYAAYAQVHLLPPRLAADLGQMTPGQFQIYQWIWEQARLAGKWGVREGLLDPEVREFAKQGLPAYYLSLMAGLAAAIFAVFLGLMALWGRKRVQAEGGPVHSAQSRSFWNPREEEPVASLGNSLSRASSGPEQKSPTPVGKERDWRFGCTTPPNEQRDATTPKKGRVVRDKPTVTERSARQTAGALGSMQASLDTSQRCINEAETALERLQRSTLNLALTHPSLEAVDDVTEAHLAMASLDRLLRNLKSSQAEISEQLTQLNADHYSSRGARFS